MDPIGERAARLAGEHVSKTNAVLGITRVLSVEASRRGRIRHISVKLSSKTCLAGGV